MSTYMQRIRDAVGHDLVLVPSVAAIIRDAHDRVLVVQDGASGQWSLPAGGIEPGETPEDALMREVAEETGLRVQKAQLIAALGGDAFRHRYPNGDRVEYTILVYACDVDNASPIASDGEATAFDWVPASEVTAWLTLPYPPELFLRER